MVGPPRLDWETPGSETKTKLREQVIDLCNASDGFVGKLSKSNGSISRLCAKTSEMIEAFGKSERAARTQTGNATHKDLSEHEKNLWSLYWERKDYVHASTDKKKQLEKVRARLLRRRAVAR